MESHDLEALFVRFRSQNDAAALAAVFDATAPALLAVARRLSRNRSDAEDLLQATFVTAIERADVFDASRSIVPWLAGILAGHARNEARRAARRRSRELPRHGDRRSDRTDATHSNDSTDSTGASDPLADPQQLESLLRLEERAAVARAVRELPEPYRELIEARLAPSPAAIGVPLDRRSAATLAVRLHRGIARLRRLLPASLFGGLLGVTLERRALAAIRAEIVTRASAIGSTTQTVTATSTPFLLATIGASAMSKKLAGITALLVLVVAGAWIAMRDDSAPPRTESHAMTPPIVASISGDAVDAGDGAAHAARTEVVSTAGDSIPVATQNDKPPIEIRGRVIDEVTRAPVGGVTVFVDLRWRAPNRAVPASASVTAADGTFVVRVTRGVESSAVYAISSDHARAMLEIIDPGETSARRNGVAVGDLAIGPGATLRGRVIDASGRAVAGADLLLYDDSGMTSTFYPFLSRDVGTTDIDGAFTVPHVAASGLTRYVIFAISDHGPDHGSDHGSDHGPNHGPNHGHGGTEFAIPYGATETEVVEIRLSKPARLDVEVVDEAGIPMPDVRVGCGPLERPYVHYDPQVGPRILSHYQVDGPYSKATDASGRVSISSLPADSMYGITASADGFQTATTSASKLDLKEPTLVRLVLRRTGELTISGRVVDLEGKPLPGVAVERHCGYQADASKSKEGETRADSAGAFRLEGVPGGTSCELVVGASGVARIPLVVDTSKPEELADIVLVATPSAPVTGIVVDDAGRAIPDATVLLESGANAKWIRSDSFQTDEGGRFRISNAIAGHFQLKVGLPGDRATWVENWIEREVEGGASDLRIVATRQTPGIATVDIAVYDATTREPLDIIRASARRLDRVWKTTDTYMDPPRLSKGHVVFERVQPGPYRLGVSSDGHSGVNLDFTVSPTDTRVQLELPVPAPARVMVRLVADGLDDAALANALRFANVQACDEHGLGLGEGEAVPRSITKRNVTEFQFEQIPPRRVRFQLWGPEWTGGVSLDASGGGEHSIVMHVVRAGFLKIPGDEGIASTPLALHCLPVTDGSASVEDQWLILVYPGRAREEQNAAMRPGKWRYELRSGILTRNGVAGELNPTKVIAEGAFEIRSGETTELELPVTGNAK